MKVYYRISYIETGTCTIIYMFKDHTKEFECINLNNETTEFYLTISECSNMLVNFSFGEFKPNIINNSRQ